jgi:hypothetical protein
MARQGTPRCSAALTPGTYRASRHLCRSHAEASALRSAARRMCDIDRISARDLSKAALGAAAAAVPLVVFYERCADTLRHCSTVAFRRRRGSVHGRVRVPRRSRRALRCAALRRYANRYVVNADELCVALSRHYRVRSRPSAMADGLAGSHRRRARTQRWRELRCSRSTAVQCARLCGNARRGVDVDLL